MGLKSLIEERSRKIKSTQNIRKIGLTKTDPGKNFST